MFRTGVCAAVAALCGLAAAVQAESLIQSKSQPQAVVIDSFQNADTSEWSLVLADGVKGEIVEVDGALRLDYDFSAGAGYCVARRAVDLSIDPNYRFGYRWKGTGPKNTLEFKLIDPSGENVWWSVRRGIEFPSDWTDASVRRRHVSFAWGPNGHAGLKQLGYIEFAVTAVEGGRGSVWLDDLLYEPLPEHEPMPVNPHAVTGTGGTIGALPDDGAIAWDATPGDALGLSWQNAVEFSGLELDWAGDAPSAYRVDVTVNGRDYIDLGAVKDSDGGLDVLFAPETEARGVRVIVTEGTGTLRAARFLPVERLVNANDYAQMLADTAPRGTFPEYYGQLSPWTVIGLPGAHEEALVSATGAIEPVSAGCSVEPFLVVDGRVRSWADAERSCTLNDAMPIPSVRWDVDGLSLDVTAVATDIGGPTRVMARYRVRNNTGSARSVSLALAARPFQVLPATQFLNITGGMVDAGAIEVGSQSVSFGGELFARVSPPADATVATDAPSGTLRGRLSSEARRSTTGSSASGAFPEGAMLWDLEIQPGDERTVVVSLPMAGQGDAVPVADASAFDAVLHAERARWEGVVGRQRIMVPDSARRLADTIRANLAYILINADGPGIQPGSRTYERSWIRDGAMTSAALLALGHAKEAREFIDWYAPYQYDSGKIPCVVDRRGPDPVDENDAPGQFLFAIRNSAEAGGGFDESFARRMYPRVRATVDYIEMMRNKRLTDAYVSSDDPIERAKSGLMPESISHEGYSEKPMHSHWDNFWVYRGLRDAAVLAERLGEADDHERFARLASDFGKSIGASVRATAGIHGIDYVPGCVELGDFDATSTSIAFYPTGAAEVLDKQLLTQTFERAWEATKDRIEGGEWDGMTPYEVRTVGTFVRLGWVERAHAYLDWLYERQDPAGWHQWGEIAYKDREPSRFVGDMPHTWVGSGAVLSILSLFAYEDGDQMVLAAGVPGAWLTEGQPVGVSNQQTRFGALSYSVQREGDALRVTIGPGCTPEGGYRIDAARLLRGMGVAGERVTVMDSAGKNRSISGGGLLVLPSGSEGAVVRFSAD